MRKCEDCEKDAVLYEDDGCGWCYECAIEHATEEFGKEQEEERTGVSEFEISQRAMEKKISFPQAKEELIREKQEEAKLK